MQDWRVKTPQELQKRDERDFVAYIEVLLKHYKVPGKRLTVFTEHKEMPITVELRV